MFFVRRPSGKAIVFLRVREEFITVRVSVQLQIALAVRKKQTELEQEHDSDYEKLAEIKGCVTH